MQLILGRFYHRTLYSPGAREGIQKVKQLPREADNFKQDLVFLLVLAKGLLRA